MQSIDIEKQTITCYNYLGMALCNDTQSIKAAEAGLLSLSKNPAFIQILLSVPLISGISRDIAKLAINYTRTYIRNLLSSQNSAMIASTADFIVSYLSTPQIQVLFKQELSQSLIFLLQKDKSKTLILSLEQKLVKALNDTVLCQKVEQINFEGIAFFSYILIQSIPTPLNNHTQFIMQSFVNVVKVCGVLVKCIHGFVAEGKGNPQVSFSILIIFLDTIRKYLKKLRLTGVEISHMLNCNDITSLVTLTLSLSIPGNAHKHRVFYRGSPQPLLIPSSIIEKHHRIKQKIIQILNECLLILLSTTKDSEWPRLQLISQGHQFINVFIDSVNQLLEGRNYYELNSITELQIVGEIYRYLKTMLDCKLYYKVFLEAKTKLIYGLLMRTLGFSLSDYVNFTEDPDEFVNSLYQIIKYEDGSEKEEAQQQTQIKSYENVKTLSASLLICYTLRIDGTLHDLIVMSLSILNSATTQTKYTKDLFLLVLCIVRQNVVNLDKIKFIISQVLVSILKNSSVPTKNKGMKESELNSKETEQLNVQYGVLLATIDCYLPLMCEFAEELCSSLLIVIQNVITNQEVEDAIKILATGIVRRILKIDSMDFDCGKVIQLLLHAIENNAPSFRFLNCLEAVLREQVLRIGKRKDDEESMETPQIDSDLQSIQKILKKVINLISQQLQNKNLGLIILNQLWNILLQISGNIHSPASLIHHTRELLLPLLQSLNTKTETVMEEKLRKCMGNILARTLSISGLEIGYIQIVYQRFFHGEAKYSLDLYFEFLQLFISYGAHQFTSPENQKCVRQLLEMSSVSIKQQNVDGLPRGESQCCEGLFLIQSLLIAAGKAFNKGMWMATLECLYAKYKKDTIYDFVKAQVITNILLVIVYAFGFFQQEQISDLLMELLRSNYYFSYKSSSKLFAIALIELLSQIQVPFVQKHYQKILDSSIGILKMIQKGKDSLLEEQQQDSEEQHYTKLKSLSINCLNQLDQFSLFQMEIYKARELNRELVETAERGLDKNMKIYLREIMNVRKIGDNIRDIHRIKRRK